MDGHNKLSTKQSSAIKNLFIRDVFKTHQSLINPAWLKILEKENNIWKCIDWYTLNLVCLYSTVCLQWVGTLKFQVHLMVKVSYINQKLSKIQECSCSHKGDLNVYFAFKLGRKFVYNLTI